MKNSYRAQLDGNGLSVSQFYRDPEWLRSVQVYILLLYKGYIHTERSFGMLSP
jgi:hypothetical protein